MRTRGVLAHAFRFYSACRGGVDAVRASLLVEHQLKMLASEHVNTFLLFSFALSLVAKKRR